MQTNLELNHRQLGTTSFLKVLVRRRVLGESFESSTPEKVIPRIIEYDEDGNTSIISIEKLLTEVKPNPYYAGKGDFTQEKVDGVTINNLYKHLEHFPTLTPYVKNGQKVRHYLSELIYGSMSYLRPSASAQEAIKKSVNDGFQSKLIGKAINNFQLNFESKLDPYSVPKRDVGKIIYNGDQNGVSVIGKLLSFGLHKTLPADRLCRESSSLHGAEMFSNPITFPNTPKPISPFVTSLRVAIIHTDSDLLDGGILTPSGKEKVRCNLESIKYDPNYDPTSDDLNLTARVLSSSMEIVNEIKFLHEEDQSNMGPIRLILPGGVKFACSYTNESCYNLNSEIDLILDFRTIARKGALGLFWWTDLDNLGETPEYQECLDHFNNLETDLISWNGNNYHGYVIQSPVFRPGQRYTSLCKTCKISTDLVANAILNNPVRVSKSTEREYKLLSEIRNQVQEMIHENKTPSHLV